MKASELIALLQAEIAAHGDLPVTVLVDGTEAPLLEDPVSIEGGGAAIVYIAISVTEASY